MFRQGWGDGYNQVTFQPGGIMLRKLFFLLVLLMISVTACKKETPLLVNTRPTVLASERTPLPAQSSATPAIEITPTPLRLSPTSTPAISMTQMNTPTSTTAILDNTSTPAAVVADAPPLPTSTMLPEFSGFTPEELVNQGRYPFKAACQSWGACVCDSKLTASPVTVMIEFTAEGVVNITNPDGSFFYVKQSSN